jgi:hypothetical protein
LLKFRIGENQKLGGLALESDSRTCQVDSEPRQQLQTDIEDGEQENGENKSTDALRECE